MRNLMDYIDHGVYYGTTFVKNLMVASTSFFKIRIRGCSGDTIGTTRLYKTHILGGAL